MFQSFKKKKIFFSPEVALIIFFTLGNLSLFFFGDFFLRWKGVHFMKKHNTYLILCHKKLRRSSH